jgi:TPR repeat protein
MTNKLTIVSNRNIVTKNSPTASLLGRGLNNLRSKVNVIAATDLEVTYRQARDAYNHITDLRYRNNIEFIEQLVGISIIFHELADKNFGKVYYPLAIMYGCGQGVSQNEEKSHFYYKKAYEWCFAHKELIDCEIWSDLGSMHFYGTPLELEENQGIFWQQKAADQGFKYAQYELGESYRIGCGVEKSKEQTALWFRKAAEQGHVTSQNELGYMYKHGIGVEQNDEKSVFWFQKSADQGCENSHSNMGDIYKEGRGVVQNYELAVLWYRKAANQGNTWSQLNLGNMYKDGCGVEQDDELAFFWLSKSPRYTLETYRKMMEDCGL